MSDTPRSAFSRASGCVTVEIPWEAGAVKTNGGAAAVGLSPAFHKEVTVKPL